MVRKGSSVQSRQRARQAAELRWLEHTAHNRGVAGSTPAAATRQDESPKKCNEERTMAKNEKRIQVTLACEDCKRRNYITMKNKVNDRERIEMKKYCQWERKHTTHKETR